jgi:hypothetical protein
MGQERVDQAIGRIERALARLEAVAAQPSRSTGMADDGEIIELRRSHQQLRGRVEGAITQIDQLLAAAERG